MDTRVVVTMGMAVAETVKVVQESATAKEAAAMEVVMMVEAVDTAARSLELLVGKMVAGEMVGVAEVAEVAEVEAWGLARLAEAKVASTQVCAVAAVMGLGELMVVARAAVEPMAVVWAAVAMAVIEEVAPRQAGLEAAECNRYRSPHSQFHADIRLTLIRHVHHHSTHRGPSPACRCKHYCTRSPVVLDSVMEALGVVLWVVAAE